MEGSTEPTRQAGQKKRRRPRKRKRGTNVTSQFFGNDHSDTPRQRDPISGQQDRARGRRAQNRGNGRSQGGGDGATSTPASAEPATRVTVHGVARPAAASREGVTSNDVVADTLSQQRAALGHIVSSHGRGGPGFAEMVRGSVYSFAMRLKRTSREPMIASWHSCVGRDWRGMPHHLHACAVGLYEPSRQAAPTHELSSNVKHLGRRLYLRELERVMLASTSPPTLCSERHGQSNWIQQILFKISLYVCVRSVHVASLHVEHMARKGVRLPSLPQSGAVGYILRLYELLPSIAVVVDAIVTEIASITADSDSAASNEPLKSDVVMLLKFIDHEFVSSCQLDSAAEKESIAASVTRLLQHCTEMGVNKDVLQRIEERVVNLRLHRDHAPQLEELAWVSVGLRLLRTKVLIPPEHESVPPFPLMGEQSVAMAHQIEEESAVYLLECLEVLKLHAVAEDLRPVFGHGNWSRLVNNLMELWCTVGLSHVLVGRVAEPLAQFLSDREVKLRYGEGSCKNVTARLELLQGAVRMPREQSHPRLAAEQITVLDHLLRKSFDSEAVRTSRAEAQANVQSLIARLDRVMRGMKRARYRGLFVYGSFATGAFTLLSDVDIYVDVADDMNLFALKHVLEREGMANVFAVTGARKPIVSGKDPLTGLEFDISCTPSPAVENSTLLSLYTQLDDRVLPLLLLVKQWTKFHGIADASSSFLSSYSYQLLLVSYLQRVVPPVLPNLQSNARPLGSIAGNHITRIGAYTCGFHRDIERVRQTIQDVYPRNSSTIAELFAGFFAYYGFEAPLSAKTIAIHRDADVRRVDRFGVLQPWWRWAIEDPFERDRDLANSVRTFETFEHIRNCFRDTYERLLQTPREMSREDSDAFDPHPSRPKPKKKPGRSRRRRKGGRSDGKRDDGAKEDEIEESIEAPASWHWIA